MKTYNKSEIMARAWRIFRAYPNLSFGQCLTRSWVISKETPEYVSPKMLNKILNNLRAFNRSRSATENKPIMAGTQEHFKILNSKIGRRIMKLPVDNESKEMLSQGILVFQDIIHQRRKESAHFVDHKRKIKKTFRNRIINSATFVAIKIEDYV